MYSNYSKVNLKSAYLLKEKKKAYLLKIQRVPLCDLLVTVIFLILIKNKSSGVEDSFICLV